MASRSCRIYMSRDPAAGVMDRGVEWGGCLYTAGRGAGVEGHTGKHRCYDDMEMITSREKTKPEYGVLSVKVS